MGLQDRPNGENHLTRVRVTGNIRRNLFIQTLGPYCCVHKCWGQYLHLNFPTTGCAQYCSRAPIGHNSLSWQQPRMNICAIGIALARTDVPRCACRQRLQARFSPRERHHTTLQGTAGGGGTVTRPTVQSACNQFEIGQNNNTQEQHSDDVYTLYTDTGHTGQSTLPFSRAVTHSRQRRSKECGF